ncbi:tetratricopeptide repeat protein [Phytomonospora endophytica]|uniref:tetratricopeptide repeat protein n=1 Tax=Phytomonospora endophytica TaxID=714109 RepID=UPI0021A486A3|nr:tetratricopeptide repeat protein [Phytomonospora endophytica]
MHLERVRLSPPKVSYPELTRRVNTLRGLHARVGQTTIWEHCHRGRKRLDGELVLDIARALEASEVHVGILEQAVLALEYRTAQSGVVSVQPAIPPPPPTFSGRSREIHELCGWIASQLTSGRPTVVTIDGPPGVGKTALAARIAHQVGNLGEPMEKQFFGHLRGFDPNLPPADPEAVINEVLKLLGVDDDKIHSRRALTEKSALLSESLKDKTVLIVLDNAASPDQVAPLLPEHPGCVLLVTSRHRLNLSHRSIKASTLHPLDLADSLHLLRHYDSGNRIDSDLESAEVLAAEMCARLPLELNSLGRQLRQKQTWNLADHVSRLRKLPSEETGIASAGSYYSLSEEHRRLFRLMSLHPGADFTQYDAMALSDCSKTEAEGALEALWTVNLLDIRTPGRYQYHDLHKAYARKLLADQDRESIQKAGLAALRDYYRSMAAAAMDIYAPYTKHRRPSVNEPTEPHPTVASVDHARGWLDSERTTLLAITLEAAASGEGRFVNDMSATLVRYLDYASRWGDAELLHSTALKVADDRSRCLALDALGGVYWRQQRYDKALEHYEEACRAARESGNQAVEAGARGNLGNISEILGRFRAAAAHYEAALELASAAGTVATEGHLLGALGGLYFRLGEYRRSLGYGERALLKLGDGSNSPIEAMVLANTGAVLDRLGRSREAVQPYERALEISQTQGSRPVEAAVRTNFGVALLGIGEFSEAFEQFTEAKRISNEDGNVLLEAICSENLANFYREQGDQERALDEHHLVLEKIGPETDKPMHIQVLNDLGTTLLQLGRHAQALDNYRQALAFAIELEDRYEQARALEGIGDVSAALDESSNARTYWDDAQRLYQELEVPETDRTAAKNHGIGHEPTER